MKLFLLIFFLFAFHYSQPVESWTTVHQNQYNNGHTDHYGFNQNGTCYSWEIDPPTSNVRFPHTGVIDNKHRFLYYGATDGRIRGRGLGDLGTTMEYTPRHELSDILVCPAIGKNPLDTTIDFLYYGTEGGIFAVVDIASCHYSPHDCERFHVQLPNEAKVYSDIITADEAPFYAYFTAFSEKTLKSYVAGYRPDGTNMFFKELPSEYKYHDQDVKIPLQTAPAISGNFIFVAHSNKLSAIYRYNGTIVSQAEIYARDPLASTVSMSDTGEYAFVQTMQGRLAIFKVEYDLLVPDYVKVTLERVCKYHPYYDETCCVARDQDHCHMTESPMIYPVATPATLYQGNQVYLVQYQTTGSEFNQEGVYKILTSDGSVLWKKHSYEGVPIGSMLAAVSLDVDGDAYFISQGESGVRLWSFDVVPDAGKEALFKFMVEINNIKLRGLRGSVILSYDENNFPRIIFSAWGKILAFKDGYSCPTSKKPYSCSGNGDCDCVTATCYCNKCWSGPDCNTPKDCGFGKCIPSSGECSCLECYSGTDCKKEDTCSGRGKCLPYSEPPGVCQCDNVCVTGSRCQDIQRCSGHGTCSDLHGCQCAKGYYGLDCSQKDLSDISSLSGSAIAAGVVCGLIVLLIFLSAYVLFMNGVIGGGIPMTYTGSQDTSNFARQDYSQKGYGTEL